MRLGGRSRCRATFGKVECCVTCIWMIALDHGSWLCPYRRPCRGMHLGLDVRLFLANIICRPVDPGHPNDRLVQACQEPLSTIMEAGIQEAPNPEYAAQEVEYKRLPCPCTTLGVTPHPSHRNRCAPTAQPSRSQDPAGLLSYAERNASVRTQCCVCRGILRCCEPDIS
jgi:hypothetical protein